MFELAEYQSDIQLTQTPDANTELLTEIYFSTSVSNVSSRFSTKRRRRPLTYRRDIERKKTIE